MNYAIKLPDSSILSVAGEGSVIVVSKELPVIAWSEGSARRKRFGKTKSARSRIARGRNSTR